jgi:cytochrome b561
MGSYDGVHRAIHWITALLIFGLVPVGIVMSMRGEANLWDDLTNTLYNTHKLVGLLALIVVALRIVSRARITTPPYPPDMPRPMVMGAHAVHGLIYVLLVLVPLLGWAGVSAFPALPTIGGWQVPGLPFVPQDPAVASQIFQAHAAAALLLTALVLLHIAAGLFHLLVKKDGVFQRMWPQRT